MQRTDHRFVAMGGPCRLRIDGADTGHARRAVAAAVAEVERLEAKYSRYREDSLASAINRAAGAGSPIPIDSETAGLIEYADTAWRESGGRFDLTAGVLRRAWDFRSGTLPAAGAVAPLLDLVDWTAVERTADSVYLPRPGMEIDFGGCVKEYAADAVAGALRALDIRHALIDLAGDMVAVGAQGNGEPWPIGIRDPRGGGALAGVELADAALASSGDYERCIEVDGERYGHILDPTTGWPVRGLVSVSVVAPQCLVAGTGATVAMLMPEQDGLAWLGNLGLAWLAVDRALACHGTIASV